MARKYRVIVVVLSVVGFAAMVGGCRREAAPVAATQGAGQTYHVRGIVRGLPEAGATVRRLRIEHEAIPDFVDNFGQRVGMDAMTMSLELAPGVGVGGMAVGDKVAFDLQVRWEQNQIQITGVRALPADTVLHFGPANPGTAP